MTKMSNAPEIRLSGIGRAFDFGQRLELGKAHGRAAPSSVKILAASSKRKDEWGSKRSVSKLMGMARARVIRQHGAATLVARPVQYRGAIFTIPMY
jgi:hypothetical protein